ncbi:hypothetical protein ACCO45_007174 [Purpureocillium lilacinum]|uniref:Uncharacterized protein n=1 Tax=Purpureocillium lilacinum TaxID=33203 RepID=A0ACC4DSY9_PURLI
MADAAGTPALRNSRISSPMACPWSLQLCAAGVSDAIRCDRGLAHSGLLEREGGTAKPSRRWNVSVTASGALHTRGAESPAHRPHQGAGPQGPRCEVGTDAPGTAWMHQCMAHSSTSASRTPAHIPSLRHKRDDASRVTLHCSQATLVFQSRNNRRSPRLAIMKAAALLSLVASAAVGLAAADGLKIDVTLPVDCDRKDEKRR